MKKHMMLRAALASALALASTLAPLAAADRATGDSLRVGAISSLTGPGASSDAHLAARAYFEAINAAGGIRGRRIEYLVEDDRMDPALAQAAATRLAADERIVALAGGSSVLECAVNHQRYAEAELISIPGGGVDPLCFTSQNIAPVNAGPYVSTANALNFAHEVLRHARLCVVAPALPGMVDAFQAVVQQWADTRRVPAPALDLFRLEDALAPLVERVRTRHCGAVVYTGPEGPGIAWVQAARPVLGPKVDIIMLTSGYTARLPKALGSAGDGLYAMAEFDPWTSGSLPVADWRRLMVAHRIEPSSLSQGGYLAAQVLVKTLYAIEGPITRQSVTQALRGMKPMRTSLTAGPFMVGPGAAHAPNRSALPMRLKDGRWQIAHPQWISFDPP